jgi:hypothetical protein
MMKINQSKNHITAYPITNHKHIPIHFPCLLEHLLFTTTANNTHSKRLLFLLLIIPHAHYSLFNPLINPVMEMMLNTLSTRYTSLLISSHHITSFLLSSLHPLPSCSAASIDVLFDVKIHLYFCFCSLS